MKKNINTFCLAIGAGIAISVGGTVYLSMENRVIGALLFTVGLYAIVLNGLYLYTGKIGYWIVEEKKGEYAILLLLTWLGNLVGTGIGAFGVLLSRISAIRDEAAAICDTKLQDSPFSIFILAVFCGFLMYVAVDGFKEKGNPVILFMGVSVFILCGFEHCIANMFYFSLAGVWSLKAAAYLLLMTAGNSVGGMIIPMLKKAGK